MRIGFMGRELGQQGRIVEGYGALIEYPVSECRRHGASIHLGAAVTAHRRGPRTDRRTVVTTAPILEADAAILTVPLPLLPEIMAARSTWARFLQL
jgi:protoporphyrinogen oxidase